MARYKFRPCDEAWLYRAEILSISDGLCSDARARARIKRLGLFARQVLGTLAHTSIRNQRTDSIFPRREVSLSPPIFVPRGLIKNSTRSSYFMWNISSEAATKKTAKKKYVHAEKEENSDSAVSRDGSLSQSPPMTPPPSWPHRRFWTCRASTYTRRLYDNGRASGSPCFRFDHRRPATHFPPSHYNPSTLRSVCMFVCVCVCARALVCVHK